MTTARSHDLAAGRLRTDEIGRGSRLAFSASDAEAVDLARQLGVERIEDLTAEIVLKPWGSGLAASGQGRARVTQLCVLTLEPVVADVGFAIDERFRPETPGQGGEVDLDAPTTASR